MDPKSVGLCLLGNVVGMVGVITLNSVFVAVAIIASITTIIYNILRSIGEIGVLKKIKSKRGGNSKSKLPSDS